MNIHGKKPRPPTTPRTFSGALGATGALSATGGLGAAALCPGATGAAFAEVGGPGKHLLHLSVESIECVFSVGQCVGVDTWMCLSGQLFVCLFIIEKCTFLRWCERAPKNI